MVMLSWCKCFFVFKGTSKFINLTHAKKGNCQCYPFSLLVDVSIV